MAAGCWSLRVALEVSDRLQVSHCAAPDVSRQPWGLTVLGSGVSGWLWGLMMAPGVLQWPRDSQGSWTLRAQGGPRGLKAALGSHSVWIWGLRWPWGLTMVLGISGQLDTEVSMRL